MLSLIGRHGDGWILSSSYLPPARVPEAQARIDDAGARRGRDPAAIARLYNISRRVTNGPSAGSLDGPADQWVTELTELVMEQGMDSFIFWPSETPDGQIRRFVEEVAPGVRAGGALPRRIQARVGARCRRLLRGARYRRR
jgi:hypothetical protein